MSDALFLIPVALLLGAIGLWGFLWSLRHDQYEDLAGASERVLMVDARPEGDLGGRNDRCDT